MRSISREDVPVVSVIAEDARRLRKAKTLIKLLALAPERRLASRRSPLPSERVG